MTKKTRTSMTKTKPSTKETTSMTKKTKPSTKETTKPSSEAPPTRCSRYFHPTWSRQRSRQQRNATQMPTPRPSSPRVTPCTANRAPAPAAQHSLNGPDNRQRAPRPQPAQGGSRPDFPERDPDPDPSAIVATSDPKMPIAQALLSGCATIVHPKNTSTDALSPSLQIFANDADRARSTCIRRRCRASSTRSRSSIAPSQSPTHSGSTIKE